MRFRRALVLVAVASLTPCAPSPAGADELSIAWFSADVTPPLGHRLMGVLPVKSREVSDPLEARGFVLLGAGEPVVVAAVDWCEIRNEAYDAWRDALATAAGTTRERVMLSCLHQHDAPVADIGAERLLAIAGLGGELLDLEFHSAAVARVAAALGESIGKRRRVTRVGVGAATVAGIASNRRVALADGRVHFDRGSASGGNATLRDAPEGLIDPELRTVSFWDRDEPLVALSAYATHPMSKYGEGKVSADFPGLARRRRQAEAPGVFQVYVTGAGGDVTAGKYNDGSPESRERLVDALHRAMREAWESTRTRPIGTERSPVQFRSAELALEFHEGDAFRRESLRATLADENSPLSERILAAMGLASRARLDAGRTIDVPCLDLGASQLVLLPGEAFVGYQLMAQRLRPDSRVVAVGYGECWPGYIPTEAAFADGFNHGWRWAAHGSERRIREALWRVLRRSDPPRTVPRTGATSEDEGFAREVYPASAAHPRLSEGSVVRLRDGALVYAVTEFIEKGTDFSPAHIVARTSRDGGRTWGDKRVLQENIGGRNVMSVTLLRYRTQGLSGLGMFYLVKNGVDDLHVWLRVSTDELETLGEPIRVTAAPGYHVMNNDRVVQLLDGRLLCPIAWTENSSTVNHYTSYCEISDDGGATWRRGSGHVDAPKRGAMEPEVVELRDGRLLMIVRTQLGTIWAATSLDRGDTWSEAAPWGVTSPEAPATLRRIPSTGDLLLVWNPTSVEGAGHGGKRTPLAAAISRDEGVTWGSRRLLETDAAHTYAYTSVLFDADRVLLTYYVRDEASGRIASRFRSLPLDFFAAWQ